MLKIPAFAKPQNVSTKRMTTERHIKLGRQTALISFLLGTVIFGLYFLTSSPQLLFIGYIFLAFVGLFNIALIILLLIKASKDSINRRELFKTCVLILVNVPITVLYLWFTIILLDTLRITFTNSTSNQLTKINIIGCDDQFIEKLEIGESKTVWIKISGDCSVNINYLQNGIKKKEIVIPYTSKNLGDKRNYNIGGSNDWPF